MRAMMLVVLLFVDCADACVDGCGIGMCIDVGLVDVRIGIDICGDAGWFYVRIDVVGSGVYIYVRLQSCMYGCAF